MPEQGLDRARFAKCRAMMERGATVGEREAGESAARRVAAAAGLSLGEALRLVDAEAERATPGWRRERGPAPTERPRPWEKAPLRTDPISVEEIQAQKAANLAHLKRKAKREEAHLRAVYARQEAETAAVRAAQAARDRAWHDRRADTASEPRSAKDEAGSA